MDLHREAARNPILAQKLSHLRDPRTGEELRWKAGHPRTGIVQDAIYRTIDELPNREKEIILSRYGEGLTLRETAKQFPKIRTRERVRQIEATAIRRIRHLLLVRHKLFPFQVAVPLEIVAIPGGPLDPDWVSTREAAELTEYSLDHIRKLAREGRVESRPNEFDGRTILINKASLRAYVLGGNWRRHGVWKEENEPKIPE